MDVLGKISYTNQFYDIDVQRNTGLITQFRIDRNDEKSHNLVYKPLAFPLNEYYDYDHRQYYQPIYSFLNTSTNHSPNGIEILTKGRLRNRRLRQGSLYFEQKILMKDYSPMIEIESTRTFVDDTKVIDDSLCFIFSSNVGSRMQINNANLTTEGTFESKPPFLENPSQISTARFFLEENNNPQGGVIVHVEDVTPSLDQIRWAYRPRLKPRYCEFEVVWSDRPRVQKNSRQFIRAYVLAYQSPEQLKKYIQIVKNQCKDGELIEAMERWTR